MIPEYKPSFKPIVASVKANSHKFVLFVWSKTIDNCHCHDAAWGRKKKQIQLCSFYSTTYASLHSKTDFKVTSAVSTKLLFSYPTTMYIFTEPCSCIHAHFSKQFVWIEWDLKQSLWEKLCQSWLSQCYPNGTHIQKLARTIHWQNLTYQRKTLVY